jgi:hypothetical protein
LNSFVINFLRYLSQLSLTNPSALNLTIFHESVQSGCQTAKIKVVKAMELTRQDEPPNSDPTATTSHLSVRTQKRFGIS